MLGSGVGAGEQRIFPIEGDRPDGTFDGIGVDLDAAVIDEACQPVPARERVADGFGEFGLLADKSELLGQPWREVVSDRAALGLPHIAAFLMGSAPDIFLDLVEFGDASERFAGNRRGTGSGEFVEAPAHMMVWTPPSAGASRGR